MLFPKNVKVKLDKGTFVQKESRFGVDISPCYDGDDDDRLEPAMILYDVDEQKAKVLRTYVSTKVIRALGHFLIVQADALDEEIIKTYGMKYWKRKMNSRW